MDWTATILAVAGSRQDLEFPPDGINLLPIVTGKQKNTDRTFYWRLFQENYQKAIRDGKWKYLSFQKGEFLFDLAVDPGEQNDLKEKFPEKFNQLKKKFQDWEAGVLSPVPL